MNHQFQKELPNFSQIENPSMKHQRQVKENQEDIDFNTIFLNHHLQRESFFENVQSRRLFLRKVTELATTIGFSIVFFPMFSCEKDFSIEPLKQNIQLTINLSDEKSDILNLPILNFTGQGVTKQFSQANFGIPIIITRIKKENKEDDFLVFSGMCTHDHCFGKDKVRAPIKIETLANNRKVCRVVCNCHGSEFDLLDRGKPIKGPAEKPLKFFPSFFNSSTNELTIYF